MCLTVRQYSISDEGRCHLRKENLCLWIGLFDAANIDLSLWNEHGSGQCLVKFVTDY